MSTRETLEEVNSRNLVVRPNGLGDDPGRRIRHPCGYIEYRYCPGFTMELVNVEVDQEHRNNGIGTLLVTSLIRRNPRIRSFYGYCDAKNIHAHRFYRSLGFVLILIPNHYGNGKDAVMIQYLHPSEFV